MGRDVRYGEGGKRMGGEVGCLRGWRRTGGEDKLYGFRLLLNLAVGIIAGLGHAHVSLEG